MLTPGTCLACGYPVTLSARGVITGHSGCPADGRSHPALHQIAQTAGASRWQACTASGLYGAPASELRTRQILDMLLLLPGRNARIVNLAVTEYLSRSTSQPERRTA